jgi:hypothetical protein
MKSRETERVEVVFAQCLLNSRVSVGFKHDGHSVVELGAQFVRRGGDDGEAANSLARRPAGERDVSQNTAMPISWRSARAMR